MGADHPYPPEKKPHEPANACPISKDPHENADFTDEPQQEEEDDDDEDYSICSLFPCYASLKQRVETLAKVRLLRCPIESPLGTPRLMVISWD